jgi:hypothetical protein
MYLQGSNAYGTTDINGGALVVEGFGSLGSGAVVNNGTLILSPFTSLTVTNDISGTGGAQILGNVTLTGNVTYSNSTLVSAGML